MTFNHKDRFVHQDTSFFRRCFTDIDNIYCTPIDVLVQMDKDRLRHALARAKLVCRGLEGILNFVADLDAINPEREGK